MHTDYHHAESYTYRNTVHNTFLFQADQGIASRKIMTCINLALILVNLNFPAAVFYVDFELFVTV